MNAQKNCTTRCAEKGATAILIVIFSLLLFTVVTVGFMRSMVQDQRLSNDSELSRGAYDSALAGVEDGKRVLSRCVQEGDPVACAAIDAQDCTTISDSGIVNVTSDGETLVQTSSGDGVDYQQAYTCVKVFSDTNDFRGSLTSDGSKIVPLTAVGEYNRVKISWYAPVPGQASRTVSLPAAPIGTFTPLASWDGGTNQRPPVMRAQLMQYNDGDLRLSYFDDAVAGQSNANTLYLYPTAAGTTTSSFSVDNRRSGTLTATGVTCVSGINVAPVDSYYCHVTLDLPSAIQSVNNSTRVAYLRLTSIYNMTDFRVQLYNNLNQVQFKGVQPRIDSTGRAGDVFRRTEARVELIDPQADANLFPRATVDLTNNFCKTLIVTDNAVDFAIGSCSP
ncbi:hypothetical protein EOL96_03105 [Candidatus Saccharibacteria bacterium]|nr:hypothetical protein [Candidatus Saccharibacteria bacterium]